VVASACFHMSSPPKTSSTCFRLSLVLDVILKEFGLGVNDEEYDEYDERYLFRYWELVRAGIASPFIESSLCRNDQNIRTSGAEKHELYFHIRKFIGTLNAGGC